MATDFSKLFAGFGPCRQAVVRLLSINIGVALAIWVVRLVGWCFGFDFDWTESLLAMPGTLSELAHEPWTAITYMFVHYSPLHLIFNMLWLYWFARILTDLSGQRLLILYIGGGLAGALAFLCAPTTPGHPLCGASACVLALMTAAAVMHPGLRLNLMFFGEVKLKWLTIVCVAITLIGDGFSSDALPAHIGGALYGIVTALMFRRKASLSPFPYASKGKYFRKNSVNKQGGTIPSPRPEETICDDAERLDLLLDKIRLSGFGSLSKSERSELEAISKRLRDADSKM